MCSAASKRGLEADDCYWIANAERMTGKRRLDLRTDPPPDLAIEVDATRAARWTGWRSMPSSACPRSGASTAAP